MPTDNGVPLRLFRLPGRILPEPAVPLWRADGEALRPDPGPDRSRLDIPAIRTLFGLKTRPHHNRKHGPPAQEIVIEKPQYSLS